MNEKNNFNPYPNYSNSGSGPFQPSEESVPTRSRNRSRGVSEPFPKRFRRIPGAYQTRDWNEKAQRNAESKRYVPGKIIVNIILLTGCFTETLLEFEVLYQVVSYMSLFAIFIATDPLDALTRYIAPQSRYIVALSTAMIIVVIIKPYRPLVCIVCFIVTAGLTGIKIFNRSWLASYNWLMSSAVQTSLLYDIDNKATKAWQAHGRRETRTLLHELGYPATDDVLDIIHRPVYLCGYLCGYRKDVKCKQKLQKAEDAAETYKDSLQDLNEQLKALRTENQSLVSDQRELQARCEEAERQGTHWYELYKTEHKLATQLQEANEEIIASLAASDQVDQYDKMHQVKEQSMEDKIISAVQHGASYAEAAKIAGCSKSKAYRIYKEHEENESSISGNIIEGKVWQRNER